MPSAENDARLIRWAEVSPEFGSAMPFGSCNAVVEEGEHGGAVCGYPRREDGSCFAGHPAPPAIAETDAADHTPDWPCGGRVVCPACAARRVPDPAPWSCGDPSPHGAHTKVGDGRPCDGVIPSGESNPSGGAE